MPTSLRLSCRALLNIVLVRIKVGEIIFKDRRRKSPALDPPALSINILWVTVREWARSWCHRQVWASCMPWKFCILMACVITPARRLPISCAGQSAVRLACLMWIQNSFRQVADQWFCPLYGAGDPTLTLVVGDDGTLLRTTMYNQHHVLHQFLPDISSHHYSLRPPQHNFSLPVKYDDRSFITTLLFDNTYLLFFNIFSLVLWLTAISLYEVAFCQTGHL